jgi:hypothetical protein
MAMTIVTYHLEVENLFEVLKITEDVHYLPLYLPGPVACGVCVFFLASYVVGLYLPIPILLVAGLQFLLGLYSTSD